MSIVGIRELKARLSACIRHVRSGGTVYVTDHGRIVAELRAFAGESEELGAGHRWAEAVAKGWIIPASRPDDRSWIVGLHPGLERGTAAALLDAERGEQ